MHCLEVCQTSTLSWTVFTKNFQYVSSKTLMLGQITQVHKYVV